MTPPGARWRDALATLALVDGGAGGVIVHARDGPARQAWLQALESASGGVFRVPPSADADQLRGGCDLLASLSLGRPVHHPGLAQRLGDRTLLVCGAERLGTGLAALLAEMIDGGLAPERVSAASFAEYRPAYSNGTDEGRAQNRRIEIVVLPDLNRLPGADEIRAIADDG